VVVIPEMAAMAARRTLGEYHLRQEVAVVEAVATTGFLSMMAKRITLALVEAGAALAS
jgi:hypothetical protein